MAIKNDKNLSIQAVAKIYNIPAIIVRRRRDGYTPRRHTRPNLTNIIELEEQAVV